MTVNNPLSAYNIVYFGSLGVMSYTTLAELLKRGVNIVNVVIPGAEPGTTSTNTLTRIPIVQTPAHDTVEMLALEHNIPVTYVHELDSLEVYSAISKYSPHFIFVACFPYILPAALWRIPQLACINLHPSLLPAYRGPYPLFWQLQRGEPHMGVTLHLVNDTIDGGDIILQREIHIKHGMRERAINTTFGEAGARLFVDAIKLYKNARVQATPQAPTSATYMSTPKLEDFQLKPHWPAVQAFNFMRGTEEWHAPYYVHVGNTEIRLDSAIAYTPVGKLEEDYLIEDHYVNIRFAHGVLQAYSKIPLLTGN